MQHNMQERNQWGIDNIKKKKRNLRTVVNLMRERDKFEYFGGIYWSLVNGIHVNLRLMEKLIIVQNST